MKLQDIIFGTPASQEELDRAAICRQEKQVRLLKQTAAGCLLCLTLNIPGPIKTFPLAVDAFDEGLSEIPVSYTHLFLFPWKLQKQITPDVLHLK